METSMLSLQKFLTLLGISPSFIQLYGQNEHCVKQQGQIAVKEVDKMQTAKREQRPVKQ